MGKVHIRFVLYNKAVNWETLGIWQGYGNCIYRFWKSIWQHKERKDVVKLKNNKIIRIAYRGSKLAYSDDTDCVKVKLGWSG